MKRVMIVDDSSVVRKMIRLTIASPDILTVEASDGIDALENLAKGSPDLFIIDLNMPRMDGLALVRRIRNMDMLKDVPIIMLTTESTEEDRMRGLQAGVSMYLGKPVSPTLLRFKVQSLLKADQSPESPGFTQAGEDSISG